MQTSFLNDYARNVTELADQLPPKIKRLYPSKPGSHPPSDASSNFMINRNLGDWGEGLVRDSIDASTTGHFAVKYGRSGDLIAGDPQFKEKWKEYAIELFTNGKRPDVLVFSNGSYKLDTRDISESKDADIQDLVRLATLGIEVRSSNFSAKKYKRGVTSKFDTLTFTVKIEDIPLIVRWVQRTGVPHMYLQVPIDDTYAMGFEKALGIMVHGKEGIDYIVDKPSKSGKPTVRVPFTHGKHVGDIVGGPTLIPTRKDYPNGRVVFAVAFKDGKLAPEATTWNEIISNAERLKSS